MMQEKRIVGALQAEQNAKAAQTQAASQRAKDDYRAGEKAYDIAQASTQNTGSGKPLAIPVPVENRVTDKEREEAMTAYREGEAECGVDCGGIQVTGAGEAGGKQ
ncbi:MAG: hypothetical protein IPJ47_01725 [Anaerolineales bacterium]|nr:hypothetical protein [Anaerolineales bacterium]